MENIKLSVLLSCLSVFCACVLPLSAQESVESREPVASLPDYGEIFEIISNQLPAISEQDLQHAALQGILTEFQSQIELESNSTKEGEEQDKQASIAKMELIAEKIAYFRLHLISKGLENILREKIESFRIENGAEGIVLDLRYANGSDYDEVLRLAGLFLNDAVALLDWGSGSQKAVVASPSIQLPLVVLINESTKGAAEALAGALKLIEKAAIIGRPTSGLAMLKKRIPLESGHVLSIATGKVQLADGTPITGKGVAPDIEVDISPTEQAAYFDDPYGELISKEKESNTERLNEAALMRRQNDSNGTVEIEINVPPEGEQESNSQPNAIVDPILARGVDLLKGWTIFNRQWNR